MYVKLFSSILDSSIWRADASTRLLWITMLAMADEQGLVYASTGGLADRARITIDDCKAALAVLAAPDEDSRTEDHEGRRVEKVPGGWLLLNYAAYREIRTKGQMAAAARQARFRERQHEDGDADDVAVTGVTSNADVSRVTDITTTAYASASASEVASPEKPKAKSAITAEFDTTPFTIFGSNAELVIELVRTSHRQAAVAAAIFKHTEGSYNAGMAGAQVAHADVVGAAVQAYLANLKPDEQFTDRLFGGYVKDAVRRMGAGEQRERAKREDSHVDRERAEEEQRTREEAAIVRKIAEFKRLNPDTFALYTAQAERAIDKRISGMFRGPTVRAKLIELIDNHDGGGA